MSAEVKCPKCGRLNKTLDYPCWNCGAKRSFAAPSGSANEAEIQKLRSLRTRIHNIATGAETTADDNSALNLIARLVEDSYSPNDQADPRRPANE